MFAQTELNSLFFFFFFFFIHVFDWPALTTHITQAINLVKLGATSMFVALFYFICAFPFFVQIYYNTKTKTTRNFRLLYAKTYVPSQVRQVSLLLVFSQG